MLGEDAETRMAQSRPSEKRQASGQVREDCPLSKALPPDVLGVSKGPFLDNGTVGTQKTEGVGGRSNLANVPVAGSMASSAPMASKDGPRYLEHCSEWM